MRILIRININCQSGTVVAVQPIAPPGISADTVDWELLRPIINLCENRFHLIRDRTHNLNPVRIRNLLAVYQPPYRNLHPDHFLSGRLRRRIRGDPVVLFVYLVISFHGLSVPVIVIGLIMVICFIPFGKRLIMQIPFRIILIPEKPTIKIIVVPVGIGILIILITIRPGISRTAGAIALASSAVPGLNDAVLHPSSDSVYLASVRRRRIRQNIAVFVKIKAFRRSVSIAVDPGPSVLRISAVVILVPSPYMIHVPNPCKCRRRRHTAEHCGKNRNFCKLLFHSSFPPCFYHSVPLFYSAGLMFFAL